MPTFNTELWKRQREMERILEFTSKDLAKKIRRFKLRNPKYVGDFFKINRGLERQIDATLKVFRSATAKAMTEGAYDTWQVSNTANDAMVASFTRGLNVPSGLMSSMMQLNLGALESFLLDDLKLSSSVWRLSDNVKGNVETLLGSGIAQGKSANRIAQDVRPSLKDPNRQFRRVRDNNGNLVLSEAAKAYHPGRGVYRSSVQNARRLARTTVNRAYRTADYHRRSQLPFVTGIIVKLSASHPFPDICDSMAGEYPKGFLFTGWHAQCFCFTVSKTLSTADFKKYLRGEPIPKSSYVKTIPKSAQAYLKKNEKALKRLKTEPDWMENLRKVDLKLKQSVKPKVPKPVKG